jgi:glutamine amidotransferase
VIGIVGYRTGNATSVSHLLSKIGQPHRVLRSPADADRASHLVLPGVGAADTTMESLRQEGWVDVLNRLVLDEGMPYLGICVGMQIIFSHSEEGDVRCLDWLPGAVRRFDREAVRVPHMGWNEVRTAGQHPATTCIPSESGYYYFVNSFYATPSKERDIAGVTEYGGEFCSMTAHRNIVGVQFHAEKSGPHGERFMGSFCSMRKEEFR